MIDTSLHPIAASLQTALGPSYVSTMSPATRPPCPRYVQSRRPPRGRRAGAPPAAGTPAGEGRGKEGRAAARGAGDQREALAEADGDGVADVHLVELAEAAQLRPPLGELHQDRHDDDHRGDDPESAERRLDVFLQQQ